jgi:phage-related protein
MSTISEGPKSLSLIDRDQKSAFSHRFPCSLTLVRNLGGGLWEVRSRLRDGIARVIFFAERDVMALVHAFIKKSQKTPKDDLALARRRAAELRGG